VVGKSGVLQHKSGNVSEPRRKVTMEGLYIGTYTNALSNGTIPTPYGPLPQPKTAIAIIVGTGNATDGKFGRYNTIQYNTIQCKFV